MLASNVQMHTCSNDESKGLHLKEGSTDVVFVLEEYAPHLQKPRAMVASYLCALVGQVELKTNHNFQVWRRWTQMHTCRMYTLCFVIQQWW